MSERKVLNKYYPPDFDPSKIPKLKLPKDRQYVVRLMAPFNMRCKTCGEYIYKGKKFNARKETVQNEVYLGLPIFRFYIKCTRCLAEITFKTDPENTDYVMEHGATRNFQAEKLLEEQEKQMQKEREDEELNNPMKVLENRTKDSKMEMEVLENLQELKELNQRQANVDFESMLLEYQKYEEDLKRQQEEDDEREMKSMLESAHVKRILEDSDSDEEPLKPPCKLKPQVLRKPTDILNENADCQKKKLKPESWEKSVGKLIGNPPLSKLVVKKAQTKKADSSILRKGDSVQKDCPTNDGTNDQNSVVSPTSVVLSSTAQVQQASAACNSSLSLLGAYSDSEGSSSD
ncbi:splicing factor YJU2 isoform X1 [Carcharodon carcharias]|uniref:splicing factor YJU2 isoform X1 n=1 Tax=Carcharodon carcharias TaxID=13397 RepID=UPI001B7F63C0|nr:splicing factor YJU2 isoform X1 [Carcharodon carcharias]